jgi:hypothetical protein
MIARPLTAVMLCLVVAGASAQQDKRTAIEGEVKAIAELGYTGAAAVRCKLRPEDWNEDPAPNATEALAALTGRNSSEADQGRQCYWALKQLWSRAEAAGGNGARSLYRPRRQWETRFCLPQHPAVPGGAVSFVPAR